MSKTPKKGAKPARSTALTRPAAAEFDEVLRLIDAARGRAIAAVNKELIDLYWTIGAHISGKIAAQGWGKGTVAKLAEHIRRKQPDAKGFSAQNLWRMRQFYEAYHDQPILSPLVRELSWTHNLMILNRSKRVEEREFHLRICVREGWSKRELEHQFNGALFERVVLAPPKLSPAVRELHPDALAVFKDSYLLDFLALPNIHSEKDLQRALVANLRQFLLEVGVSPTLVAEYQTWLPDKKLLQAKLHEFYELAQTQAQGSALAGPQRRPRQGKRA